MHQILLVDDDPLLAEAMVLLLEKRLGCRVRIASDAVEAAIALLDSAPSLVLLDWMIPQGDTRLLQERAAHQPGVASLVSSLQASAAPAAGLDVLRWLKQDRAMAGLQVALFSGQADALQVPEVGDGMVDLIVKGDDPERVVRRIGGLLAG